MKAFLRKHQALLINLFVLVAIGRWLVVYTVDKYRQGILWDFVELTFLAHMVLLLVFVMVRRPHAAVDRNLFHQAVAMAAFFSGIYYQDVVSPSPALQTAARAVTMAALVLGMLTQLNLGRSFGILIALRKVRTDWLYSVIRHPMYLTDMLFKLGMLLRKPTPVNAGITLLAAGCYVYRALLEEKFLSQTPEYRLYMQKVRYRFIPWLF